MAGAYPHMIGCSFIAEGGWNWCVYREPCLICKGKAQLSQRTSPFMTAMGHGLKICDGQVAAPVNCVGHR